MKSETTGTVISVSKQWWLKINTKAVRKYPMDGAVFPHIIKVTYIVNGKNTRVKNGSVPVSRSLRKAVLLRSFMRMMRLLRQRSSINRIGSC